MTNTKVLRQLRDRANQMATQAAYVLNNITKGSVTHTQASLRKLINHVAQISKHMDTNKSYGDRFEKMIFQCQAGPLEVTRQKDMIYIQGIVHIDGLKEFFIVNEPPGFDALEVAEIGK